MTALTNELLTNALMHTDSWKKAEESMHLKDSSQPYPAK